jgi:hypothetical protein
VGISLQREREEASQQCIEVRREQRVGYRSGAECTVLQVECIERWRVLQGGVPCRVKGIARWVNIAGWSVFQGGVEGIVGWRTLENEGYCRMEYIAGWWVLKGRYQSTVG